MPVNILINALWWSGPSLLIKPRTKWPNKDTYLDNTTLEARIVANVVSVEDRFFFKN